MPLQILDVLADEGNRTASLFGGVDLGRADLKSTPVIRAPQVPHQRTKARSTRRLLFFMSASSKIQLAQASQSRFDLFPCSHPIPEARLKIDGPNQEIAEQDCPDGETDDCPDVELAK